MSDDETHVSNTGSSAPEPEHHSGWAEEETSSSQPNFDAWHQGSSQPPTNGWNSAGSWPGRSPYSSSGSGPYARSQSVPPPPPPPESKKRSIGWLGPAVVILAGIVAFCLVLFFTQGKNSTPQSNNSSSVAAAPQQPASSSSSSSTSQQTDSLPSGDTQCKVGKTSSYSNISAPNAVSTGRMMSCDFADKVISDIQGHVRSAPSATSFPLANELSDYNGKSYSFTCNRQNHVTNCTAQGDYGQIGLAVQDNVS